MSPMAAAFSVADEREEGDDADSSTRHTVQFYDGDEFLVGAVADFLRAGLSAGEQVIVVASEQHRTAFALRLAFAGVDVPRAVDEGQLLLLDAAATLSRFMKDGAFDAAAFHATMRPLFNEPTLSSRRVRAYGEMVSVLWRAGQGKAAILLEEAWNDLGRVFSFNLLCAYLMSDFHGEECASDFMRICEAHTHTLPAESYPQDGSAAERLGEIARLQQRAQALERELERRSELEKKLRDALADRGRLEHELRLQNEELARTVRFSEMFVGILGHDLRNPLAAVMTSAEHLLRRAPSERVADTGKRILSSAGRMARMIDQILDITRIRLGKGIPLDRQPIDLVELCRSAIAELETDEVRGRVQLSVQGNGTGVWDSDRLAQLISNLVGNALSHGTAGEPVVVDIDGTGPGVCIAVRNSGTIPADVLPTLFAPMTSGEPKSRRSPGLGLGLFISHEIVLAHGGTIAAVTSAERGTSLEIELPRSPA